MDHGTREKDRESRAYPKNMALENGGDSVSRMLRGFGFFEILAGKSGAIILQVRLHDMVRA